MKHGTGRRSFEALIAAVRFGRHAVIGERNAALLPFRTDVKNVILWHHENADGSEALGMREEQTDQSLRTLLRCLETEKKTSSMCSTPRQRNEDAPFAVISVRENCLRISARSATRIRAISWAQNETDGGCSTETKILRWFRDCFSGFEFT